MVRKAPGHIFVCFSHFPHLAWVNADIRRKADMFSYLHAELQSKLLCSFDNILFFS
jgi:hypothetical protein